VAVTGRRDPAHGTVVLTGDGYCNELTPDTFTYTLNGGSSAIVSVTVNCPDGGSGR
jgi:hypothetical protein